MKKILKNWFKFIAMSLVGRKKSTSLAKLILDVCKVSPLEYLTDYKAKHYLSDIDIFHVAYQTANIDDYGDEVHTGEMYLIKEVLPIYLDTNSMTIFDVGANVGNYTTLINKVWPTAKIYSFEPNSFVFESLNKLELKNVSKYNLGLGSVTQKSQIYTYGNPDGSSEHGSLLKGVFTDLHHEQNLLALDIEIETLDNFCSNANITQIDFLKIDTEGFEFEVLKGASNLIMADKIKIIQIEFNEMNTVAKVFLLDFYNLLKHKYSFFRLKKNSLYPLGEYNTYNEIFRYQNLIFINNNLLQKNKFN